MKIKQSFRRIALLSFILALSSSAIGQAPRISFQVSTPPIQVFSFETLNLPISQQGAYYSHLWWFGDNGFSFVERPNYSYQRWNTTTVNTFAITTENYGTGGPPPLVTNPAPNPTSGNPNPARVLTPGNSIFMQRYRNAVVNDTLYLIVTYSLPDAAPLQVASGELNFQFDPSTTLISSFVNSTPEFTPNGEVLSSTNKWSFANLKKGEERSILVPLLTGRRAEDIVNFRVDLSIEGYETSPSEGITFYEMGVAVAKSHDPNKMIENSQATTNCDFGGEQIDYIVEFQNMGDTTTHFVSITSYLDDKLDLNSISDIILPEIYVPSQISRGTLNHHYVTNAGAIYDIDFANRTITFELNDLVLRTVQDETCKNLALTRSEIKFSVRMKPNYIFGDPVAAHSSIVFDANEPIITDSVFTICDDPLPMNNGGGFYNQDPTTSVSVIDNIWIYLLIGLGVLLVIILGVRRFKKN